MMRLKNSEVFRQKLLVEDFIGPALRLHANEMCGGFGDGTIGFFVTYKLLEFRV